jgi:hypothetical protein
LQGGSFVYLTTREDLYLRMMVGWQIEKTRQVFEKGL